MENELEQQLSSILNDPSAMQNIIAMAQSLSGIPSATPNEKDVIPMQQLANLASKSNIDQQQSSLLSALRPYLSNDRLNKLEKAMRAARMAKIATLFISGSR